MSAVEWLSVENTLCFVLGYRLSWLEAFAVVLSLWAYLEIIRGRIRGLVLGMGSTLLMATLFRELRLYSDMLLMFYYCAASLVAICFWHGSGRKSPRDNISRLNLLERVGLLVGVALLTGMLRLLSGNLHELFPGWFHGAAVYPWADALTAALCIVASILVIRKKVECMALWLAANLIGIVLYLRVGVFFLATIYVVYAVMDMVGLVLWNHRAEKIS